MGCTNCCIPPIARRNRPPNALQKHPSRRKRSTLPKFATVSQGAPRRIACAIRARHFERSTGPFDQVLPDHASPPNLHFAFKPNPPPSARTCGPDMDARCTPGVHSVTRPNPVFAKKLDLPPQLGKTIQNNSEKVRNSMLKQTGLMIAAAAGLMLALPQTADAHEIYPVKSAHNFCPSGLQPVTIDGSISCGTPTTTVSYHSMMAHPAPTRKAHKRVHHTRHHAAPTACPPGMKGCN